jgi:hypothetical protein
VKLSRLLWAAALALLLLVVLLVNAPARMLGAVLPGGQVIMQGFTGTLWRGSASQCMLRVPAGYIHLGAVRWSLDPLSLLALAPRLELTSHWGNQVVEGELVVRGPRDFDFHELQARVRADLLRHFAPVAIDGQFSLQINALALRDGLPFSGDGRLVWERAVWLSPRGPVALGTYALDFMQAEEEPLLGEVLTVDGPLAATGNLRLEDRRYEIDILISSEETMEGRLTRMLELVAAPEGDRFRIRLDGEF